MGTVSIVVAELYVQRFHSVHAYLRYLPGWCTSVWTSAFDIVHSSNNETMNEAGYRRQRKAPHSSTTQAGKAVPTWHAMCVGAGTI
jgi:hypothetical protein